ncbi:hypothetical protein AWR36_004585 [Microbulbifer flavimaris]|uniref:Sulfotransferase family protein n=1 Tax=Microbulbifer flavimaris TaxID=1781068 RepID=A0ABX4I4B1_9GAMM|nr:hypothetical protein AVO43_04585 [Microbulbifer sp. ZGT114]PCO07018.1 hypothetical protein AWR36_004585 [Microbulbifer flavimaris]
MASLIYANPKLKALSSHQIVPPLPIGDFEVFPIIFIRHPILRAKSAYLFEWQRQLNLAQPKGSFGEYVEEKLEAGSGGAISDFHVYQMANTSLDSRWPVRSEDPLRRLSAAKIFLESLPFFGLVEHFQVSLERMHFYLKYHFPELEIVHRKINVTDVSELSVDSKISIIKSELGADLFRKLESCNKLDLDFYQFATDKFMNVVPKEVEL